MTGFNWQDRNRMFEGLASEVKKQDSAHSIVAGDLNCTPWSWWFKKLLSDSGLKDSGRGNGLAATWNPFGVPLSGLTIDHVLIGSKIKCTDRFVGGHIGSDHRPVFVDFLIEKKRFP